VAQKGNDLVIFFTNDGDPVRDVSLVAPEGATAFIQPSKMIARREMGSMRITNICEESLKAADLKISYSFGSGKIVKQLLYEGDKHRLVAQ
jgi:hypothetical protein